jgi:RND family efflux transporter MFP subunit
MTYLILPPFVLLAILLSGGCGEKIAPGETKQPSKTVHRLAVATARITDERLIYDAVATVQAGLTANLSGKYAGAVKEIKVREGARVKKGQTLVILDQAQASAGFHQVEAALSEAKKALAAATSNRDAARATRQLALATFERYRNLKKTESVGDQEFDEVTARHRQGEAALAQAEDMVEASTARVKQATAAVAAARVTLEDMVLTAPFDGIISARLVDEGVLASPGMPLLTIETTSGYRADAVLAETYIDYAHLQQKVLVKIPALNDEILQGMITTIVPAADERSRTFLLKVAIPPHSQLKSGLFARVQIPLGASSCLLVHKQAVVTRGQLTGLFMVDAEKIARFHLIRTGRTFGDLVEVLAGLREGDRYVENPPLQLMEGDGVEVMP